MVDYLLKKKNLNSFTNVLTSNIRVIIYRQCAYVV